MTPLENIQLLHRILSVTWAGGIDALLLGSSASTDPNHPCITVHVRCNDVFGWACADCEEITPANVDVFEATWKEVDAINTAAMNASGGKLYFDVGDQAAVLFACRVRNQRPFKHQDSYGVAKAIEHLVVALPAP